LNHIFYIRINGPDYRHGNYVQLRMADDGWRWWNIKNISQAITERMRLPNAVWSERLPFQQNPILMVTTALCNK